MDGETFTRKVLWRKQIWKKLHSNNVHRISYTEIKRAFIQPQALGRKALGGDFHTFYAL